MEINIAPGQSGGWLVRMGRLGYAVKGVVYIVVGFLATKAATGNGGETTDTHGALETIGSGPFGQLGLIIIAAGLLGYAAWRLASALTDAERRGDEPTSIALRLGEAFRGLVYGSVGLWTLRYLITHRSRNTNQTNETSEAVSSALNLPLGRWLVIAAALGIVAYALYQIYRALSGKFMKRLDLSSAGKAGRTWTPRLGRFGITARAVVFSVMGVLVARAGWNFDPSQAGGIEESLDAIARGSYGIYLFASVALGLIAYGMFQIATARYRVMRSS